MKILVYGSDNFDNYSTFMRALVLAIKDNIHNDDTKVEVLSAGPHKVNNFTAEFINVTEDYFKQMKVKTKFTRVKRSDVTQNFEEYGIDHVISFNSKSDSRFFDVLLDKAEKLNVSSSLYKY